MNLKRAGQFLRRDRLAKGTSLFLLVLIFAVVFLYRFSFNRMDQALVEQMLHREQVIARSEALLLAGFFKDVSRELKTLPQPPPTAVLKEIIAEWQGTPLAQLVRFNEFGDKTVGVYQNGLVLTDDPVNVADRQYFLWAKEAPAGQVFIGAPVIARAGAYRGQFILPLVTPIRSGTQFQGVALAGVLVTDLIQYYLEPLLISDQTRVYLLDGDNNIIASSHPERVGQVLGEATSEAETAKRRELEAKVQVKNKLVALAAVDVEGKNWYLAVETPLSDALLFRSGWRPSLKQWLALSLFILILGSCLCTILVRFNQDRFYFKGYQDGRKER